MEYKVKINEFEGPLDLLLHLIKDANIDIYDIKLEEITKQYLNYIKAMETLNLSIASEYLVMAAELIELKSKSLLPNNKNDDNDEFEEDPREVLIRKLIDYKKYKELTSYFKELESTRKFIYTKTPSNISEFSNKTAIKNDNNTSVDDLLLAFKKFVERKNYEKPLNTTVTYKEFSVSERTSAIRKMLTDNKRIYFEDLFENGNKPFIIVTFLAILELANKEEIVIKQKELFDKIYIELRGCA